MGSLPEISLTTAALLIFVLSAGYMLLRGFIRTLISTAVLLASAYLGFRVWELSPELVLQTTGSTSSILTIGLPVATFVLSFIILRKILRFFRSPLSSITPRSHPRSGGGFLFRILAAIIPTTFISVVAAAFIRHAGSISEIASFSEETTTDRSFVEQLKGEVIDWIPAYILNFIDPSGADSNTQLAKLVLAGQRTDLPPVIDPVTGRSYPRALVVDDPAVQTLAKEGKFSSLLRHPALKEALADPAVQDLLRRSQ